VNYSGVAPRIPEGGKFGVDLPGAPDTVRCARPGQPSVVFCSFYLNPFLDFLLVCVEPLASFRKRFDPISLSISPFLVIDANTNQSKYISAKLN
jgi:hypothetical protein